LRMQFVQFRDRRNHVSGAGLFSFWIHARHCCAPCADEAAEKLPNIPVIPSGARNLSFYSWAWTGKRFFASLGMTK
jgi:hypothetical protein